VVEWFSIRSEMTASLAGVHGIGITSNSPSDSRKISRDSPRATPATAKRSSVSSCRCSARRIPSARTRPTR
jgi:hypothetical protein